MNTEGAIKALAKHGYKAHIVGKNQYTVSWPGGEPISAPYRRDGHVSSLYKDKNVWNGREIVNFARNVNSSWNHSSKDIKMNQKHGERRRQRDLIAKGDFDRIPTKKSIHKEDNRD